MSEIDWDKVPEWANYHAFDEDKQGFWYGVKPKLLRSIGIWGLVSGIVQKSDLSPTFKNYQKTLTLRPGYSEKPNTHCKCKQAEFTRDLEQDSDAMCGRL